MHVISRQALRKFWERHPPAKEPLTAWFRVLESCDFPDFGAVRPTFGTADYLAPYTIFNVGGNKYRVITAIHYNRKRLYVRHVFTHPEYDRWSRQMRKVGRSSR